MLDHDPLARVLTIDLSRRILETATPMGVIDEGFMGQAIEA